MSGETLEIITTRTPRVLMTSRELQSGRYEWQVSYTDTKGLRQSSTWRRFAVAESNTLSIPSGIAFARSIAQKGRPRSVPSGASATAIAGMASGGEFAASYAAFLQAAGAAADTSNLVSPAEKTRSDFSSDAAYFSWLLELRRIAMRERVAIEQLGYALHFTGDQRYAVTGVDRLVRLALWSPTGVTSEASQDQANREIYLALAQGLDLFAGKLSSEQAAIVVSSLKARLQQVVAGSQTFDRDPYNSHSFTATQYVTEALIHALGSMSFPESESMLAKAWEDWVCNLGPWGGSDGAFGNGGAYGWYTMTVLPRGLALVRLAGGVDLSKWPVISGFGDNQIAFTPAASRLRGQFGDHAELDSHYFDYTGDDYRLYAATTRLPRHEWYWRAHAPFTNAKIALNPLHYMLLGLKASPIEPSAPAINSWIFEDAGMVAFHTQTSSAARSSLFFRSSRLGSFNHSHADNNAFTFVSKGRDLLVSGGYYPYYMSPHHALVGRATRFKNALTFDGGIGQAEPNALSTAPGAPLHSMETRGKLINYADNGTWGVATGDATLAYRGLAPNQTWMPLLSNAFRSVAFNRAEGVALVYDWASSDTARKWELNFQSLNAPQITSQSVQVSNGPSRACIDTHGPPMILSSTKGFPIAAENGLPDQYQTRFTATTAANQLVTVTVIREDCRAVPISVELVGTRASVSVNGSRVITFDKQTVIFPN